MSYLHSYSFHHSHHSLTRSQSPHPHTKSPPPSPYTPFPHPITLTSSHQPNLHNIHSILPHIPHIPPSIVPRFFLSTISFPSLSHRPRVRTIYTGLVFNGYEQHTTIRTMPAVRLDLDLRVRGNRSLGMPPVPPPLPGGMRCNPEYPPKTLHRQLNTTPFNHPPITSPYIVSPQYNHTIATHRQHICEPIINRPPIQPTYRHTPSAQI